MVLDHDIDQEEHDQQKHLNNFVQSYIEDIVSLFKKILSIKEEFYFSHIVRNCGRLNQARSGSVDTTKRVV